MLTPQHMIIYIYGSAPVDGFATNVALSHLSLLRPGRRLTLMFYPRAINSALCLLTSILLTLSLCHSFPSIHAVVEDTGYLQ